MKLNQRDNVKHLVEAGAQIIPRSFTYSILKPHFDMATYLMDLGANLDDIKLGGVALNYIEWEDFKAWIAGLAKFLKEKGAELMKIFEGK